MIFPYKIKSLIIIDPVSWAGFVRENSGIDVDFLIKEIDKIKNKVYNTYDVSFYPDLTNNELRKYYSDEQFIPESYPLQCMSPWMEVYIFPDGSVKPCLSMDYVAGNIREESFLKIWNNEKMVCFLFVRNIQSFTDFNQKSVVV